MAGLHRQGDVETQFVLDATGPREQQVDRLTLAGAMHPHQPGALVITSPAEVYRGRSRTTEALSRQRLRQSRIVFERQLFVA